MRLRLFLVACVACLALTVQPAAAQPIQDTTGVAFSVQMPDSVVVTAARTESDLQETGRRVTVYNQRDIRDLAVNSIDQLLDVVGGVDVQSRGGFGVQGDLTMRGSTFNGVLLLLDGARINDPMTGHFLMDLPIPLSEIARVEVLRGPATALYGPDALGGVVHLITKTGLQEKQRDNAGFSAEANGTYGKHNLYDAGGAARHRSEERAISGAVSFQGSDGQTARDGDGNPVSDPRGGSIQTDFARRTATAAISQDLGGPTFYARAGVDDREFSAWHYYTSSSFDKAREATSTFWLQSRLTSDQAAEYPWQVQVSGKQHRDRYTFNPAPPFSTNRHTSRMLNVQGQVSRTIGDVRLTTGGSGQLRGIDSNALGLRSDVMGGGFLSLQWQATSRLTINQSTRVDYDPLYGVEPTPQLFLAYDLGPATLRAGGGRAVRAPDYLERFIENGGNQGDPNLDSEQSWSGEIGADVQLPQNVGFHVTGFARDTEDLIDYLFDSGEEKFFAQNLDSRTRGIETEATFDRTFQSSRIHLESSYTYLDSEFDVEPVSAYKYAVTTPRHLLQGSASFALGSTTVGLQGLWKERVSDAGPAPQSFAVFHGRLQHAVQLGGSTATLSLEVRNLLDEEYSEIFDAPLPGRMLLVGASVQL